MIFELQKIAADWRLFRCRFKYAGVNQKFHDRVHAVVGFQHSGPVVEKDFQTRFFNKTLSVYAR